MAKDLTKLYSRPGAEAYHVFEDDNGQVQVKMGDRTVVTAVPSESGMAIPGIEKIINAPTFAAAAAVKDKALVFVVSDETNDGAVSAYFYDGQKLNWLPSVEV